MRGQLGHPPLGELVFWLTAWIFRNAGHSNDMGDVDPKSELALGNGQHAGCKDASGSIDRPRGCTPAGHPCLSLPAVVYHAMGALVAMGHGC